ncbi:MAG TPA: hypothetical protein VLV76_07820 [Candidatus Acidoferrum sp.]|nr:hypothetical protein [Candidatus Acidoferrum sp.]
MSDSDGRGRKLLKQHGDVQLSQESVEAPRGRRCVRYFVGLAGGPARSFDTPHSAWDHFQELAGAAATPA